MEKTSRSRGILMFAAVSGQFLALLPLAVAFSGLGAGGFQPWIYCAVYAVWGVFYAAGHFSGKLARESELSGKPSRKAQPVVLFLSRAAVIIPAAAMIAVMIIARVTELAVFYVLPGGIITFFGAHRGVAKGYSDVFTRAWFALYFGLALLVSVMLWSSHDEQLLSGGITRLCVGFAVMIVLSAVLTNQTNIDVCTRQRSGGRAVLPEGLRRYNALLITALFAAVAGLFLLAEPLSKLVTALISVIVRGVLFIFEKLSGCVSTVPGDETPNEPGGSVGDLPTDGANSLADLVFVLILIALAAIIFLLRKQIWSFIKSLFEPLFRKRSSADIPFSDEIFVSDARTLSPKARRRAERELARRYRKESDPARRYRFGYALFLVRLGKTSRPPEPPDTTSVHREKGESAFRRDLGELSGVYNRVRYGESAPTAEELSRQEKLLAELK